MEALVIVFGGFSLLAVSIVISTLLNGWALSILWGWFIVSTFGLPAITLGQAIGLSMVVNFLTYQYVDAAKEKKSLSDSMAGVLGLAIFRPLVTVGIGWIIHSFMF